MSIYIEMETMKRIIGVVLRNVVLLLMQMPFLIFKMMKAKFFIWR